MGCLLFGLIGFDLTASCLLVVDLFTVCLVLWFDELVFCCSCLFVIWCLLRLVTVVVWIVLFCGSVLAISGFAGLV